MKKVKRLFTLLLAVLTLSCSLVLPTNAASNVCLNVSGSAANCDKWTTIVVETGKNWGKNKITFSQTKGRIRYSGSCFDTNTYGAYTIKVTNQDTNETETYYWKYKQTYTLKLNDKTTYTIKIKPYQVATVGDQNVSNLSSIVHRVCGTYNKNNWSWSSAPTWKIKSTKAVSWCYSGN